MIVLSVHDGHDCGATLLRDGKIVLHSSEERRINVKNASGVPIHSLQALFERTDIEPGDVDLIALCGTIRNLGPELLKKRSTPHFLMQLLAAAARSEIATRLGRHVLPTLRRKQETMSALAELGLADTPVETFDHHLCHAACAYFHRPWDGDALVLTHDGAGDGLCATVAVGSGSEIRTVAQTPKFHSLANGLYSAITEHLGMKPWEHEYKVMGMAPYGRAEDVMPLIEDLFSVSGLHFVNHTGRSLYGLKRLYHQRLAGQRFDNVSAACQELFERLMLEWVENAIEATGIGNVCAAGGAFLNVKANKVLRESPAVEALYVYPASDDGGIPIGGALLGYLRTCRERGAEPSFELTQDMYSGLEFSEREIEATLAESALPFRKLEQPADEVASLLAGGSIVATFSGREEVGPRALGHRSILADPRDLAVVRRLNAAIKQRDFWMPFAASVLEEAAERYVRGLSPWPFWMIEAFDTSPVGQRDMAAALHPQDLTVRPQVVGAADSRYRDVLDGFRRRTGVGALLNTSFNLHGLPIVGSPLDAIETFERSDLDALCLESFLVSKTER